MKRTAAALVGIALALAGCDSPTRTVETTRRQIAEFQASPTDQRQAAVEESLAKLDVQIAELAKKGDAVQKRSLPPADHEAPIRLPGRENQQGID